MRPGVAGQPATARGANRQRASGSLLTLLTYGIVACVFAPFLWLISTSLKRSVDAFAMPPALWFKPTLDEYREVVSSADFLAAYGNSLVVVIVTTVLSLAFGVTSGYVLARTDSKGTRLMGGWIILARMAPAMGFALPFFLMFRTFGLLDTYPALVLVYLTITLPFTTWLMAGYFASIPVALEEAARMDGCSRLGALFRVVLPAALPGISSAAIFSFISSWNEFFYPLVLSGYRTQTASVSLQGFVGDTGVEWGQLCAASVLVLIPVLIFTSFAQRGLVNGLTHGATK